MNHLLDAMDELNRARDLTRLIAMTARENPDDDDHAIAAGCEAIEERFEAAFKLMKQAKEAQPVAMTATTPRAALPSGDTPILRLFRQHEEIIKAARAHVCAATDEDERGEERERLFYRRSSQIGDEMMALPCTCAADFAAKAILMIGESDCCLDWATDPFWQEARALTGAEPVSVTPTPSIVDHLPGYYLAEWRKAQAEYEATPGDDEEADKALFQRMRHLAETILEAEPITPEGAAAQLEVMMADGMVEDHAAGHATKMIERIMTSLRAGGGDE